MDFGVRPRHKTIKSGVAHFKLSPSQESKIKSMLICFLTVRGSSTRNLCHHDKLSIKLIIGKSLKDSGPGIARTWMLHHDNAPYHTAVSSNEFLAEKSIPVVPQPPSLPDLSPCDYVYGYMYIYKSEYKCL